MTAAASRNSVRAGLLAILAAFVATSAAAGTRGDFDLCRSIATPLVRLACFDAIAIAVASSNADADAFGADVAELLTCAPIETAARRAACYLAIADGDQRPGAPADAEQGAPEAKPVEEFGAERLARRETTEDEGARASLAAAVIKLETDKRGIRTFYLENGQVWRQNEARYVPIPKDREFSVTIQIGTFGDYRLRVEGKGPMTRVRRIK